MLFRKSVQRESILEILRGTNTHPTADWIYEKLKKDIPELSLGTVYRNLKVLIEQGLIQKLPFGSSFDRFEYTITPHYHLICEKCGNVTDFCVPQNTAIHEQVEKQCNFKVNRHRIDFFGICEECQKKQNLSI